MRELFIDTANIDEISESINRGVISGVTTNPSLMAKEPKADYVGHMQKIADLLKEKQEQITSFDIPLSVEVFAVEPEEIEKQAISLVKNIDYKNLNIKIPIGWNELPVIRRLADLGIKVNCTCCYTASQLMLGVAAGASYVSLFYNRARDREINVHFTLQETNEFIRKNSYDCRIISGSIRTPQDITDAWTFGSHIVTAGFNVVRESSKHPGTDASVEQFTNDFKAWIK